MNTIEKEIADKMLESIRVEAVKELGDVDRRICLYHKFLDTVNLRIGIEQSVQQHGKFSSRLRLVEEVILNQSRVSNKD